MNLQEYWDFDLEILEKKDAKKIYDQLQETIKQCNKAYYIDDAPLMEDTTYDRLFHLCLDIEKKYPDFLKSESVTSLVGHAAAEKFEKIAHDTPMLSLSNGFAEEDIQDFTKRAQNFLLLDQFPAIFCEPKIDGLSFSAIFENGKLSKAATRGDGYIGEDITANLRMIENFPKNIPNISLPKLEVRGEIYMDKKDFLALNQKQSEEGKNLFANPRNAAAGSIRQLNSAITKQRKLKYFVYAAIGLEHIAKTQEELLKNIKSLGFRVNDISAKATSFSQMMSFYKQILESRDSLEYEIDGIVYKINEFALQRRMGYVSRRPRYAIAHKFPAEKIQTRLKDIIVQVGKSGILTPVAVLEPALIGGARVSRASMYNFSETKRKDIRIGDLVFLQRAGDVIPQITEVDKSARAGDEKKITAPSKCPVCGSDVINDGDIIIRCSAQNSCPAQLHGRITHFVSRAALGIEGLGKKQIEFLLNEKLINFPQDIFHLERNNTSLARIENKPGWGAKSVKNLFENINKAKDISLDKFIYSLAISHVGTQNAKLLARYFTSADIFFSSMKKLAAGEDRVDEKLILIDGFGEKIVEDIKNFFVIDDNIKIVEALMAEMKIADFADQNFSASAIYDKNLLFTGTMDSMSREEAKFLAEKLGARILSSVSKNLDLLIAGQKPGSKLKKAQEMNIKIISEKEWIDLTKTS